jgi:hypothetical protein
MVVDLAKKAEDAAQNNEKKNYIKLLLCYQIEDGM